MHVTAAGTVCIAPLQPRAPQCATPGSRRIPPSGSVGGLALASATRTSPAAYGAAWADGLIAGHPSPTARVRERLRRGLAAVGVYSKLRMRELVCLRRAGSNALPGHVCWGVRRSTL